MTPDVLIVEDDGSIRELYKTALQQAGLHVMIAENGAIGVIKALQEHPKVILMDIMMPEMNGHDAVAKIREDAWGKTAKIIFLTNMSDAEDITKAVEQRSDEYIVKAHAEPSEVVNMVRMAIHT